MVKIQKYFFFCSLMGMLQLIDGIEAHELLEILKIVTDIKKVQSKLPDKELISLMNRLFENCSNNNNPEECKSQLRPDLLKRKIALSRILSNDLGNLAKLAQINHESGSDSKKQHLRKRRALLALLGQLLGPLAGVVTESEGAGYISKIEKLNEGQTAMNSLIWKQKIEEKTQMDHIEAKVERQSGQIQDVREKVTEVTSRLNSLVLYEKLFEQVKNLSEGSHQLEEKLDKFMEATQSVINSVKRVKARTPDAQD
ncbi:uncharacterized protein LOC117176974 [Belonocnema kinseyi]|uniref:uncharacterized protein LOC117176974 n=1 Tax=Belonocnema kinseyi TaxID=2817044 RepID=UPI00143D644F|nr:uncharacterized protein LOC117176974 [Belonocnema kinseyi]